MTWLIPVAGTSAETTVNASFDLYVAKQIVLGAVVKAVDSNHHVEVDGTIAGVVDALWFDDTSGTGNVATVHKDGVVRGFDGSGIAFSGSNSTLTNDGRVFGGLAGVVVGTGETTSGTTTLVNRGSIESDDQAVTRFKNGEIIVLNNFGTISGDSFSFGRLNQQDYVGVDKITNSGVMIGKIDLGGGADLYDGRLGKVVGAIDGGAGVDKIYGGAEANVINGGADADTLMGNGGNDILKGDAGIDTIYGGLGGDALVGGADNDFFVFNTALSAASRDRIFDMNLASNDTIRLENAIFMGLGAASNHFLLTGQFNVNNANGVALQPDDRIIYDKDNGQLWYDSNGSLSGGTIVNFATVNPNQVLTWADFYVI